MPVKDVTSKDRPKPKPGEIEEVRSAVVEPDCSGTMKDMGGSKSNDWNKVLIDQAFGSLWLSHPDEELRGRQINATVAFMVQSKPADEMEAMMAAQMFAAHNATMECYRRSMIAEQTFAGRQEALNQANKLSRTFATLTEALARHRGKSTQQKVTVKHVHVYEGGQAAFGNFNAPGAGTGGGADQRNGEQPHAKAAADEDACYAPNPALLSLDPRGNVLPIPSNAERAVSHARRKEPRRAKG